ncbi:MAG: glycosyltransferase [Candidatus Wallbacteria bacterium]|nr:glycosyltransferase [Candidatus Wallbacteria bacterium]
MKILFLIGSLDTGGSEWQLTMLARGLAHAGHRVSVATMYPRLALQGPLLEAGVTIHCLAKKGRWDVAGFLTRLLWLVRSERPDVLHSYLVIPNLLVALLKPWMPGVRIVWGVRASRMDLTRYDWFSRFTFRLATFASRFADLILVNSKAGFVHHRDLGYPGDRMRIVPNGIDTGYFRRDRAAGLAVRREWDVKESEPLVGLVARLDPMKDHATFLAAAELLVKRGVAMRFVCVGDGAPDFARGLHEMTAARGLERHVVWAGARGDMPQVYSALDVLVSSSVCEGFSNTVAEAMACGVPCVVTDVGDSAALVGVTGLVVPARSPEALADAIERTLQRPGADPAARAHSIEERFSIERLVSSTAEALEQLLARGGRD